jgi:hypothetical protein
MLGSSVDELEASAEDLRRLGEALEALARMPQTLETLGAFKPRPFGALEQRVAKAAVAVAAASKEKGSGKSDAGKLLKDVTDLAKAAERMAQLSTGDVPEEIARTYGGGQLGMIEGKWRAVVGEMATQLAGGGELDRKRLGRLEAVGGMIDAVRDAAGVEQSTKRIPALWPWVDWAANVEQVQGVMTPYRDALAGAVSGFLAEADEPIAKWARLRRRYGPVMRFVMRSAGYAEQCAKLPGGWLGSVSRLLTPMERQAFETERAGGFLIVAWSKYQAGVDVAAAELAAKATARRLARDADLGGEFKDEDEEKPAAPASAPATRHAKAPARGN